ncbi:MAG: sugar phosphate isomerase/epimerase [Planctomycetota bacterium]|nr:sugar phosphate isomerase/epimerase [Planctomycetota bacterium]
MKTGFRTCGFARWNLRDAFAAIKSAGYEGVEICLETHALLSGPSVDLDALRGAASAAGNAGLEIASISYHGDADAPALRRKRAAAAVRAAGRIGAGVLILNAPRFAPGRKERELLAFAERIAPLCEAAGREGIVVAVEPEPFLAVEGSEDMLRLLRLVGSKALRVNLDVGHAFITDRDVPAYIRLLGGRIAHTHFEDIAGRVHRHLPPGEGEMPLGEFVRALRDIRYSGYLTVDLFHIQDAPAEYARRAIKGLLAAMDGEGRRR